MGLWGVVKKVGKKAAGVAKKAATPALAVGGAFLSGGVATAAPVVAKGAINVAEAINGGGGGKRPPNSTGSPGLPPSYMQGPIVTAAPVPAIAPAPAASPVPAPTEAMSMRTADGRVYYPRLDGPWNWLRRNAVPVGAVGVMGGLLLGALGAFRRK